MSGRWMESLCCGAGVVVPVEVTAHLRVRANETLSESISDTARTIRIQALNMEPDLAEAYCAACGASVACGPFVDEETFALIGEIGAQP